MNRKRIDLEQKLYRTQQTIHKPDVYGIERRKVNKIKNELINSHNNKDDDDDFDNDIVATQIESDSINAANYLIRLNNTGIPICFLHQIYSILPNPTMIDNELQEAILSGKWRKFHIIGSVEDEYVMMKVQDYCKMIEKIKSEEKDVIAKYMSIIQDERYFNQVTISTHDLNDFGLNDLGIKELVNNGLLIPHLQVNLYWFSIRKQGYFMSNITHGRTEILRMISKRPTKDIMETLLKAKKLHKTILNMDFLIHDLVGSGRVERYSIGTMGNMLKMTSKGRLL
ncbi:Serine/threonine-protein kinase 19 [Rhizopus azygosporus]|uniref:Serine/threonine-protein kinase 19 n=1 Tax=Rhizopus azygosporus TaxID=86630 RepID=A0A367JLF9_RHIAZ|nr:Serine/threonine-protein kinase 19 [Rhizopus azygosporus]